MSRKIENNYFLDLIRPPGMAIDSDTLLQNLRPGGGSERLMYGYLGPDEKLENVIEDDERTLSRIGLTHDQIATTIEDVFLHMPKSINGHRLYLFDYIHSPVCPWDDFCAVSPLDYSFKVTEIWLCNRAHFRKLRILLRLWNRERRLARLSQLVNKDWVLVLSDLHPHLIRDHRFFEGRGNPYRVDPERFLRYFGKQNIHPYG